MSRTKIPFPVRVPFVESLGLELHACAHGASELRVDLADAHMNSWEVAHGGVLMTMLDVAMATAARSDHLDGPGVATIEMKTSFVRPAEGELRALGKLLHRTSTLAFCEASVLDDTGELCAHATGTFKYLRKLPVKGRGVKALQRTNPDTP
ncbi:MAG: PaaI family thioesterase [Vitreoscilla sp.]|mgnify:CR=1 FL=1|jgi:uncharacterized protein (TIGR00369 family)|nr:PaaI family thioesterase [Vitreoscilla sp.]